MADELETVRMKLSLISAYPHMMEKILKMGEEDEETEEDFDEEARPLAADEVTEMFDVLQSLDQMGFFVEEINATERPTRG